MSRTIVQGLNFRNQSHKFDVSKLEDAIERGYMARAREGKETKKVSFAPSSIGYGHGTCARYWYQAFDGAWFDDQVDAMGIANMENGSAAHERIQRVFQDAGILVASEVEMKMTDPPIRGYIDALVKIDGEILVGEIKTTRQEAFIFRQNSMKPSANHLLQILIYLKATGKQNGFLMYENKNDQTYLIIPVSYNERNAKILEDCLDWLRSVRKAWEDRQLPLRPWTARNKNCRGCPLFELCWPTKEVDGERVPDLEARKAVPAGDVKIDPMELPTL